VAEQASALLGRYPAVSLVWAAHDEMAFGVMHAAEQERQLLYSGRNNSKRGLQARIDDRISVLVSGHFILAAAPW
jgi:ABC-type sugar transport system substrate-binding protein